MLPAAALLLASLAAAAAQAPAQAPAPLQRQEVGRGQTEGAREARPAAAAAAEGCRARPPPQLLATRSPPLRIALRRWSCAPS